MEKIMKTVESYDYVSFDIFDTLIKRKCGEPQSVFDIVQAKTHCTDFALKRIEAEKEARRKKHAEVTLDEIYECMYGCSYDAIIRAKNEEIKAELNVCIPNAEIMPLYKKCIDEGKVVIITSDMYLPLNVIENILLKTGITGYKEVFLSNNYGRTKSEGLFSVVLNTFGLEPSELMHIGNSLNHDYLPARKMGCRAIKLSY